MRAEAGEGRREGVCRAATASASGNAAKRKQAAAAGSKAATSSRAASSSKQQQQHTPARDQVLCSATKSCEGWRLSGVAAVGSPYATALSGYAKGTAAVTRFDGVLHRRRWTAPSGGLVKPPLYPHRQATLSIAASEQRSKGHWGSRDRSGQGYKHPFVLPLRSGLGASDRGLQC